MKEYHKIETIFRRSEVTKKLIVGSYQNEAVAFVADKQWEFTEKIDGTNVRVYWDGHTVQFNGRTDNAQMPGRLRILLEKMFLGEVNAQMFEQKFGETPVMLYGEGYGIGIQDSGYDSKAVHFILFDVEIEGMYLRRDAVADVAKYFGLTVVPTLFIGTIMDGVEYVKKMKYSTLDDHTFMEGIVGRPVVELYDRRGKRLIVKLKTVDFD